MTEQELYLAEALRQSNLLGLLPKGWDRVGVRTPSGLGEYEEDTKLYQDALRKLMMMNEKRSAMGDDPLPFLMKSPNPVGYTPPKYATGGLNSLRGIYAGPRRVR